MPIKGLEDRIRLPRIGKFKLGYKKVNADGSPAGAEQTPYFVVPDELRAIVGDKPTEVRVRFPSTSPALLFPCDMNRWATGGLLTLRCDGAVAHELPRDGQERWFECQWQDRAKPCPCGAKAEGRLSFLVLDDQGRGYGPYQVTIRGTQRVADVVGFLAFYIGILGAKFIFAPFILRRVPTPMSYTDAQGRRRTRTNYPIQILCDGTLELPAALPPGIEPRTLPAHDEAPEPDETDDESNEPAVDLTGAVEAPDEHAQPQPSATMAESARPESRDPSDAVGRALYEAGHPPTGGFGDAPPAATGTHAAAEPWTHERVAGLLKIVNPPPRTFADYLKVRFGHGFDDLGAGELTALGLELTAADASGEPGRAEFKGKMFEALKAAATSRR